MFSTFIEHPLPHYLVGRISPFTLEQMNLCLRIPWMMHIKVSLWYAPGILLPDATAFHAHHSNTARALHLYTCLCLLQFHGNDGLGDAPNAVPTAASVTFSASPGKLFASNVSCAHITTCLGYQLHAQSVLGCIPQLTAC